VIVGWVSQSLVTQDALCTSMTQCIPQDKKQRVPKMSTRLSNNQQSPCTRKNHTRCYHPMHVMRLERGLNHSRVTSYHFLVVDSWITATGLTFGYECKNMMQAWMFECWSSGPSLVYLWWADMQIYDTHIWYTALFLHFALATSNRNLSTSD
jgi:hypothetical protein